jgi:hypothetical protein
VDGEKHHLSTLTEKFAGWTPIRLYWREGEPTVDWCFIGAERFTEPFFEQTIARVMQHPGRMLFRRQTPVSELHRISELQATLPPSGLIFHMSRCGSTLISQMLAALPQSIAISEAGAIDTAIRSDGRQPQVTHAERVQWLRSLVLAYGRRRNPAEQQYFVKLDCWHMMEFRLIREAFPDTPWIFVYRNPLEVLVSQMRQPAYWTLPGALDSSQFGMHAQEGVRISREEYCARILAGILEQAALHCGDHGYLLEYQELPQAVWTKLPSVFGVTFSQGDVTSMQHAARLDAKNPYFEFQSDSEAKRASARPAVVDLCDSLLMPLYARLEQIRSTQNSPRLSKTT